LHFVAASLQLPLEGKHEELYLLALETVTGEEKEELTIHKINIFLELFHFCTVFTGRLEEFLTPNLRRLNWEVLPRGQYPWEKLQPHVQPVLNNAKEQNRVVAEYRIAKITSHQPEFVAVGRAGFVGYLVFGFPEKDLYVLESAFTGNATYVFDKDWEDLSKRTKAEIIQGKLEKDRIIHRENWHYHIDRLLAS